MPGGARGPSPASVHPVLACADAIEQALKDVQRVDPDFMTTEEKAAALRRLDRLGDQVTALRLRVMAGAGDVAEVTADHSVATWLAAETRTDPRERAGELALARSLERRWTRLGAAVADGSVNLPQARVIARALEDLPERGGGPGALARAEGGAGRVRRDVRAARAAAAGTPDPRGRRARDL